MGQEIRKITRTEEAVATLAGADFEGLRSFADAHPGVPRVVVALVPEQGVEVLPYRRFFERLDSWL